LDTRVIRHLLQLLRGHRWTVPLLAVFSLLASLAEGLGIGLVIPLLDSVLDDASSVPSGPLARAMQYMGSLVSGEHALLLLAALLVLLVVFKTLFLLLHAALATRTTGRVTCELRMKLSARLLDVDYGWFATRDQGRLMNTIESQPYHIGGALTDLVNLASAAVAAVVIMVLLLLLSWQLTLLAVVALLPVSLVVQGLSRRAHRLGQSLNDAYAALAGRMMELLVAMRTIRLFNQEQGENQRIARVAERLRHIFVRTEGMTASVPAISELLYLPAFLAVLAWAVSRGVGVPSLLAFIALLYRLQPHVKMLNQCRVALDSYAGGIQQVVDLLREDDKPRTSSGSLPFHALRDGITFEGVGFSHAGTEVPAVSDLSFRIPKGAVFAIVGGSGAGKSTVIGLLCRLYDPQAGAIRVDGTPLAHLDLRSWRGRLAFAGQDGELLEGTVRENILYGAPSASDAEVIAAARQAHAHDFITELPQGYDTLLSPRGMNLSGGQRQRIALARALIRKPELLILDEATNAVDNVTELAIQETVEQLAGRCTMLIVAHRLGTIRRADHVLVMAGGRIIEQGQPGELLARGGEFLKLHELA
jgi:ABC-type multidrug transport system fused ATPase/permease subunit